MRWEIWYADGSTYSSDAGNPWESPPWGALVVTQWNPNREILSEGRDFFIFRADLGEWLEVDQIGLIDQLAHHAHVVLAVRPGKRVARHEWKDIMRRLNAMGGSP